MKRRSVSFIGFALFALIVYWALAYMGVLPWPGR